MAATVDLAMSLGILTPLGWHMECSHDEAEESLGSPVASN